MTRPVVKLKAAELGLGLCAWRIVWGTVVRGCVSKTTLSQTRTHV